MRLRTLIMSAALAAAPVMSWAEDISVVRHATAEWKGFTDADGSGLYNELIREVFSTADVEVEREYVPLNRAIVLVERGRSDFTGGFSKDDRNFATYPIYETTVGLMMRKDLRPNFSSLDDLEGLRIVGPPALSGEVPVQNMTEVDNRLQAAKLITAGRADVYIDLMPILEEFVATGLATLDVSDGISIEDRIDVNAITTRRDCEFR